MFLAKALRIRVEWAESNHEETSMMLWEGELDMNTQRSKLLHFCLPLYLILYAGLVQRP